MFFSKFKAFLRLSRLPFVSVSLTPSVVGVILAARETTLNVPIMMLTFAGVFFIQLTTHFMNEYGDFEADSANEDFTPFSGGSRVLQESHFTPAFSFACAMVCIGISIIIGSILFFGFKTGPFTLPLGGIGLVCGLFYSAKPFRWAYTGAGEILIGFCFGWLTVNTAYYLQTGTFGLLPTMASLPAVFGIMAVIILNEFPDFDPDRLSSKKNLVVRLGKAKMVVVYQALLMLECLFALLLLFFDARWWLPILLIPSLLITIVNIRAVRGGQYEDREKLIPTCGRTILLNILTSVAIAIAFL